MTESIWEAIANPTSAVESAMRNSQAGAAASGGGFQLAVEGGDILGAINSLSPEALATPGGGGSLAEEATPQELLQQALAETVAPVLPTSSGFEYGKDKLPHWFPDTIQSLVDDGTIQYGDLQGIYDPYFGAAETIADDRVFLNRENHRVWMPDAKAIKDIENEVRPGIEGKLYGDRYTPVKAKRKKRDNTITYQQAVNMPYEWDDDEVAANMRRFREAGINVTDFESLKDAWSLMVQRASQTYASTKGKKKVSPWDVLELHKREQQKAGTFQNFESGVKRQTVSRVAEISEGAAWSTLQTTLSALLGRDPDDREVRDFAYRMNNLAAKNPSITEVITRYNAGEETTTQETTEGGFDTQDLAREAYEEAQDDPEYAKVQAGTTYYNALLQAIGSVGT